jgi:hypothetical protein
VMTLMKLRALLAGVPPVELEHDPAVSHAIDAEVAYLESKEAIASIALDPYRPKWSAPWWSMLMLYELGAVQRIPARVVSAMVDGLTALPLHIFPIHSEDWPPNVDQQLGSMCHCAVGCMDQVLAACGVDVDRSLPWIEPWYRRYQMVDGGYNCDESAYLVSNECPSSMVGTVASFEALIHRGPSQTCDRAAAFLIGRELRLGSPTLHNEDERAAAKSWPELCFPRFYFYDVLRGITALVRWASEQSRTIPLRAVAPVAEQLVARFPDGIVRIGRVAFAGKTTLAFDSGVWKRRRAKVNPLLALVSSAGAASPVLTQRWGFTRRALIALIDGGQVIAEPS